MPTRPTTDVDTPADVDVSTQERAATRERAERTWLGLAALALAGAGFVLVAGVAGALAAVTLAVAWYALPLPYAVALGHLLLVASVPGGTGLAVLVPAEAGLLGLLLSEAPAVDAPLRFGAAFLGTATVLIGVAAAGFAAGGPVGAALALAVVAATLGYGLHRYELLRLGFLDTDGT